LQQQLEGHNQEESQTKLQLVEQMEDLIHDVEGTDAYNGFGTSMEDDGFYDTLPDFTQLVVD